MTPVIGNIIGCAVWSLITYVVAMQLVEHETAVILTVGSLVGWWIGFVISLAWRGSPAP